MRLTVEQGTGVTVVRVDEAKLTYPVLRPFFTEVQRQIEGGARRLVVDMAPVAFIDSPAIGCLMDLYRLLHEAGGTLKLAGVQPRVETMLSMTGVFKFLETHETADDARADFGEAFLPAYSASRNATSASRSSAVNTNPSAVS
jgi:anti-anti-sigma factor